MPIDASIPLGVKPIPIESPMNSLAKALQMQSLQQENQMNGVKAQQMQAAADRQSKLYSVLGGLAPNATNDDRITALRSNGYLNEADQVETGIGNRRKIEADAAYKDIETVAKRMDLAGQTLGFVMKNPTLNNAHAALDFLERNRVYTPEVVAQYKAQVAKDPQAISQLAEMGYRSALAAKDQLLQVSTRNTGGTTDTLGADQVTGKVQTINSVKNTQSPDSAATQATAMRGQNMVDSRAREAATNGKTQIVQSDNGPVLVNMVTGMGRVITGADGAALPGVTKPLNDSQSKALLFGSRMKEADAALAQLASEGTNTSVPGSRTPLIGGAVTALSSENRQMLDQAKLDFMTAVLRRESGAAISSGEYDNANRQYFPQIGDSKGVIEQKAKNRALAIRGVLSEVPEKQRGSISSSGDTSNSVQTPDGQVHNFPSAAAASAFKKAAGL